MKISREQNTEKPKAKGARKRREESSSGWKLLENKNYNQKV